MDDADIAAFVQWFQSSGGSIDTKVMGIADVPRSGRGAIAMCDIPEGYTIFTLPRAITLSTRTSPLPALFGFDAWRAHRLHKGWVGLILCMMWEDAWTHELDVVDRDRQSQDNIQTKWGPYMRTLPTTFDTPMFWSSEELEELRGTSVVDKIGREDAERAYSEQLVPAIKTAPNLFPPSHHGKWYTLDAYHRAGSRILSRSFTVHRWKDDDEIEEDKDRDGVAEESGASEVEDPHPNTFTESSTHVGDAHSPSPLLDDTNEELNSDSEDDEDDPSDVAMVPMADLLNARWGSENAKLFYEPFVLRMVTTKKVKQGEQIFNTYGDPPNSDLLRRYGHVDLVRIHSPSRDSTPDRLEDVEMKDCDTDVETILRLGNPSDVVEVRADLIVHVVQRSNFSSKMKDVHTRIEWWLGEGEDDTFVLSLPGPGSALSAILPPALISLIRLIIMPEGDFKSARSKGKLPKGHFKKGDVKDSKQVLEILDEVLNQCEGMYIGGSVEDDERLLSLPETLAERKRHAVIARLGEKRILRDVRQRIRMMFAELSVTSRTEFGDEKDNTRRDNVGEDGGKAGSNRKRVVNGREGGSEWKRARK
ncbi:hypothetical protein JVT61DRAFT_3293 [Boletus reticuloceps]|uniref:SET domain-containing protein n=1 Tax=Boletus reticuloceps TaxID=495285 RepID=A0A8I2YPF5_9AGAM|nr:hypothetical protein JVT61DRAFT_3293 [Boletus reticuloceps]